MSDSDLMRGERLQIMLSPEELAALDDFRFKQRMPSRAAAVRELLRLGLAAVGISPAEPGVKSGHFGVLGKGPGSPRGDGLAANARPAAGRKG
jgi:hypothetical protein